MPSFDFHCQIDENIFSLTIFLTRLCTGVVMLYVAVGSLLYYRDFLYNAAALGWPMPVAVGITISVSLLFLGLLLILGWFTRIVSGLSALATAAAFFAHFLPTTTPWHPIIASALFLVPGIPLINSISDMINNYLISGSARFIHTSLVIGGMTFGIVFAINAVSLDAFTQLHMVPENDYSRFVTCAAMGAIGFSILFNLPPRLLFAAGIGGVIAVCTRNFCIFTMGWSSVTGTFIGATLVSIISLYAIHWLHAPTQVLTVPSVIPLVPGVLIYRMLFAIINIRDVSTEQLIHAIQAGVDAVMIILGIAIGVATPNIFADRRFERRKKEEQERLLKEAYETDE